MNQDSENENFKKYFLQSFLFNFMKIVKGNPPHINKIS